tara:strand:- start:1535 stop:2575 length:1041 start_codon:yes stop_codon:yes gene_type:complete
LKNILFIGLGSIGQRHFRNLKKLNKDFSFFALRKKRTSPMLDNNNKVINKKFISSKNGIIELSHKILKKKKFHTVFICNPSSMHIKSSLDYVNKCKNLFIEKPLSNNMRNVKKLLKKVKLYKTQCAVGFQLRYHPFANKIRNIIKSKKLGEIKKADLRNSYYLPYHHKYEDYKISYAANKKLGGGVILCFIHEIDYANFFFGKPLSVVCVGGKKSKLKIDVEDCVSMRVKYKNRKNYFLAKIDLDFLEKNEKRFCKLVFEKGTIFWNLKYDWMSIKDKNNHLKKIKSPVANRNDLFLKQIREVMENFNKHRLPKSNLINGVSSLQVALAAKKSLKNNKVVNISNSL